MRKVFSSADDVIHVFAQRSQSEGRSSNVFFSRDKIYSYGYHYLLGEFIDENTIIINDGRCSSTTAKHISSLRYGTRQYKQFFTTETDLNLVWYEVLGLKEKLIKARKPENYINRILYLWTKMNEFIEYRKHKMVKKEDKYKEIKKLVDAINKDSSGLKQKLVVAKKKAEDAKKKKDAAIIKESLKKFNSYEIDYFRVGDEDFLRLSQDGNQVETSQNVKIEVSDAKKLYLAIKAGVDIKGYRISNYIVKSINGHLVIGCHNINMNSVRQVGDKILTL